MFRLYLGLWLFYGLRSMGSVLKSGPVQFFTSILRQPDCNQSFYFQDLRQLD